MEHRASERVEEQSHAEVTVKMEMEETRRPAEYVEIKINCYEEELFLGQGVIPKTTLTVKEEILDYSLKDVEGLLSGEAVTPQRAAAMKHRGMYPALQSPQLKIHKECLDSVCRVKLRRLNTFQCEVCYAVYADIHKLLRHEREVHGSVVRRSLHRHVKSAKRFNRRHQCAAGSEPRIYICEYCEKTFTIRTRIIYHVTRVHASGSYQCKQCNKFFKCEQYLKTHTADVHNARKQMCKVCWKSVNYLRKHMRNMHSDKQLQCKLCGDTVTSKHYLRQHLNGHHRQQSVGSLAAQESLMEHPGTGTALHSLQLKTRTERLESICKMQLRRLDQFQFELGDKVHTDTQKVPRHVQEVRRSGRRKTLHRHANTPQLSNGRRQRAAESHQQSTGSSFENDSKSKRNWRQHDGHDKCSRATVGDLGAEANTSTHQRNVVAVKEESADGELELGPVVLQHMDCNYRPHTEGPQLDICS